MRSARIVTIMNEEDFRAYIAEFNARIYWPRGTQPHNGIGLVARRLITFWPRGTHSQMRLVLVPHQSTSRNPEASRAKAVPALTAPGPEGFVPR